MQDFSQFLVKLFEDLYGTQLVMGVDVELEARRKSNTGILVFPLRVLDKLQ